MRSIRFSLLVYFLLLMGAALAAVSFFCYQSTQEALAAKERSTKELLIKKFEEDRTDIMSKFDVKVRARGREIGGDIMVYHNRLESLQMLAVVGTDMFNGGITNMLLPLAGLTHPATANRFSQLQSVPRVQGPHPDNEAYQGAARDGEFYQVYVPLRQEGPPSPDSPPKGWPSLHEASHAPLGSLGWHLSKEQREKADRDQSPIDEVVLVAGQKVRRVTLKVTVTRIRLGLVVPPLSGLKDSFPRLPKVGDIPGPARFRPVVYLQFGIDTSSRDEAVSTGREKLENSLGDLRDDLETSRAELGLNLFWISLGAFGAMVIGGFLLVPRGLAPLDRLSDAVSKVSEKDFRLPIDQKNLPRELKPIAGRLAETLEQLRRVFEREKQAAADISHELRTPVAALLTTLEIALRKPRSADEYREVLEDCRGSGLQINQIVERLLTLARLDAGADLLRPRDVDVSALADQCVALVRPLAEARGLQLRIHHNGPSSLYADPDKVREVLTNLLHNAIAYNKTDGSIDVQVHRHNGSVAMEVRDTGIGISPETRKRIFERFFRADPSRHVDDSPHAGLGLAIVKGYVELMGGSVEVDSTEGAGSTFRVCLPVR